MFSKNMLQKYQSGRGSITCRKHTSGPATELLCTFCHRKRPLSYFSKSARRVNGGSQHCRDCVAWHESDLPGYAPLPAPNAQRSCSERLFYNRPQQVWDRFDEEEEEEEAQMEEANGFNSTTVQASSVDRSGHFPDGNPDDAAAYGLQNFNTLNIGSNRDDSNPEPPAVTGYALQNFNMLNLDSSRDDQSHHASSAPTESDSKIDNDSTVDSRSHVEFNAYGPDGQYQKRVESITAASETPATGVTSGHDSVPGRKNWAKVPGRKTAIIAPAYLSYENPDEVGNDYDYDSDGSADYC